MNRILRTGQKKISKKYFRTYYAPNNFQSNVDGLTLARSKEIINKYFPKDKLQFLLIGKSEDIKDIAANYGVVTEKDIKADGF